MKKVQKLVLCLSSLILLSSCSSRLKAAYEVSLDDVQNPAKISFTKGKPVSINYDTEPTITSFEDDFIKIGWIPDVKFFQFKLINKTNSTIKLLWNEVVFSNIDNTNYKVINGSTKYQDDEKSLLDSSILAGGSITNMVYPSGWVSYETDIGISLLMGINASGWTTPALFPVYIKSDDKNKLKANMHKKYDNKSIKIYMPLLINNEKKEYTFTFKINNLSFKED